MYLSRIEGGRGSIGVQDTVETAILGLRRNYVRNCKERFLIAAGTIEDADRETPIEYKKRKKNERKIHWV